ncbi:GntR family transcriptional regulator [Micromonospora qiuiae]|uniref:GntR family transcriptional regulator n=1 Tax=Micromonospora qiuiae TaxID=502268 RepID=A0ABQ4JL73_9ACTN|nr:FadR/GntR family transcriptional regulator [Micromonospora qiuiae]GIJ30309.1 GntR family transcriptional regulator [Micromonospora qiuiae]
MSSDRQIKRIEPVRRLKVADSVAAQLERLITEGEYEPGDKLPSERVLSEQFGVGRSSMREALRMVEAGGLLRTDHGVGVFVVSKTKRRQGLADMLLIDDYTIPDLFEVRLSLERDAAGLAAQRITPAAAAELRDLIERSADPALSDAEFIELDGELHKAIAKATNNLLLLRLAESLQPLFTIYSHRVIALPGRRAIAHEGHCRIVDAVIGRRVRDAKAAAVNHIREVEANIVQRLQDGSG